MIKSILGKYVQQRMKTIVFILTFAFLFLSSMPVFAVIMPWNKEGKFVKISKDCKIGYYTPIKLKDGDILFPNYPNSCIFNPQTNTCTKGDKMLMHGIVLNNGKIFSAAHWCKHPLDDDYFYSQIDQYIRSKGVTTKNLKHLSKDKQEKFILPYIQDNPALIERYMRQKNLYLENPYGKLYTIGANEINHTKGTRHIARVMPEEILLDDGRVLIVGGSPGNKATKEAIKDITQIEIYDPKSDSFKLVKTNLNLPSVITGIPYVTPVKLNDGKIFIVIASVYIIFDPNTDTVSDQKPFIPNLPFRSITKLNDDRILVLVIAPFKNTVYDKIINPEDIRKLTGHSIDYYYNRNRDGDYNHILIFDPKTETVMYGGKLARKRGDTPGVSVLSDNEVMIYGGQKGSDLFGMHHTAHKSAEIYNIKTCKSKNIGNMHYERYRSGKNLLTESGKLIIYGEAKNEMYIPRNRRK